MCNKDDLSRRMTLLHLMLRSEPAHDQTVTISNKIARSLTFEVLGLEVTFTMSEFARLPDNLRFEALGLRVKLLGGTDVFDSPRDPIRQEISYVVPVRATYLLYTLLPKVDRQTIPGDLEEEFHTSILPKFGPRRAKIWYWTQTLTTIARCNPIVKWVFVGGGILKVFDWLTRRITG